MALIMVAHPEMAGQPVGKEVQALAEAAPDLIGSWVEALHRRKFRTSIDRPAQAVSVKIGRNDPCPCGSGKKYKKCQP